MGMTARTARKIIAILPDETFHPMRSAASSGFPARIHFASRSGNLERLDAAGSPGAGSRSPDKLCGRVPGGHPFRSSPARSGSANDPVSELEATLTELRNHPGVDHVILLGTDGLVVQHLGSGSGDEEGVAARIPGIETACSSLGAAARRGPFTTAVIEYEMGVAVVVSLPGDLLLAALLRSGVGFAPLLKDLRGKRNRLVELL